MKKEDDVCLMQRGDKKREGQKWWQDRQRGGQGKKRVTDEDMKERPTPKH
jgi:hypothetical protein